MAGCDITICGLGPGAWEAVPAGVIDTLRRAEVIFLRTERHPAVSKLKAEKISFQSFDRYYEEEDSFEAVYRRIAATILENARKRPLVYAVPGHPMVAEEPSRLIIEGAAREGLAVELIPAMSFLDAVYAALGLDPGRGMVILDGLNLDPKRIFPALPAIVMQVYNRLAASEAKLFLMDHYPDLHPVTVIRAAGVSGEERRAEIPLYELDRIAWIDHLTSVYLPPVDERPKPVHSVAPIVRIMSRLRGEGGCPWDREQTHQSLKKYLLEETYEVLEAIESANPHNLCEELGDLLLQIVFHCQIAAEAGEFDFDEVVKAITKKMVFRHPHIFGDVQLRSSRDVAVSWERLKKAEKPGDLALDGIPKALPALTKAARVQEKAAHVGFDWDDWRGAMTKVEEETAELARAIGEARGVAGEVGDLLFAMVNLARLLGVEAEEVLNRSTEKFIRRMRFIEKRAQEKGVELKDLDLAKMDAWWEEAKKQEN
ncbi:MAG TPA: nucleoside triphosphate pyrophosphohydrolase [Desulfotomaculum sp.]|nr:nucleoside triphosphate pyrophosphohydrolase [Desulfotomaculum sp.]